MSDSVVLTPLGKIVTTSANTVANIQLGIDKILWGSTVQRPKLTAVYDPKSGSINYTTVPVAASPTSSNAIGSFVQSGLFNAMDALNSVDLCDVISYLTDMVSFNTAKKPRPPKSEWTALEVVFYELQDAAGSVQTQIDKYTAYPNVFIGSYIGSGPNIVPIDQAVSQSGAPSQGGSAVAAYNIFFLMKSIKETFNITGEGTGSLFTAQDKTLLTTVPGLGANLNFIDDFITGVNKYSDYRNIPYEDLQKLIQQIAQIRSVCVTIENLNYSLNGKNTVALIGNFLGGDIRAQIQKLQEFLDPTKIVPTLKEINAALQGFIKSAQQIQGILRLGQFLIKLALVFNKVFSFIIQFFLANPAPGISLTAGIISRFETAKTKAKDETKGVAVLLKTINSLLEVVVSFIRYILANTNELLYRLDILLVKLEGCQAVKNSDVISQLQETRGSLIALKEQFETYITQYDSKVNADSMMFGGYDIRVVDEELTDKAITNKRRRGIALDTRGQIVAQSDLTFATNTSVIIAEVQHNLMALGLVKTEVGIIDAATLGTIGTSINYLDSNDIAENDLNINQSANSSAETVESLGISSFIEGLPGGAKFKQNSKTVMATYTDSAKAQVANQKTSSGNGGGSSVESTQNINKVGYNNRGLNNQDTRRPR